MELGLTELETEQVVAVWTLACAGFIFLGVVGQSLIEAGLSRAGFSQYVLTKNAFMLGIGFIMWWVFGYAFAFGEVADFIGGKFFAGHLWMQTTKYSEALVYCVIGVYVMMIINGAVIERVQIYVHLFAALFLLSFIWPVIVAWCWGGGWLQNYFVHRFLDVGGSATIHLFAGSFALPALLIAGSRLGRYPGKVVTPVYEFKASSLVLFTVGGMLEAIAIIYINALRAGNFEKAGMAFFNTWVAGAAAGVISLMLGTIGTRKISEHFICAVKGTIAGMVIVAAFCQSIEVWEAFAHGVAAGLLFSIVKQLEDRLHLDDTAYVLAAHFIPGLFGCVGAGFWDDDNGAYHDTDGSQIGYQLAGAACVMAWGALWGLVVFGAFGVIGKLKLPEEVQVEGLDKAELGLDGFQSQRRLKEVTDAGASSQ